MHRDAHIALDKGLYMGEVINITPHCGASPPAHAHIADLGLRYARCRVTANRPRTNGPIHEQPGVAQGG